MKGSCGDQRSGKTWNIREDDREKNQISLSLKLIIVETPLCVTYHYSLGQLDCLVITNGRHLKPHSCTLRGTLCIWY